MPGSEKQPLDKEARMYVTKKARSNRARDAARRGAGANFRAARVALTGLIAPTFSDQLAALVAVAVSADRVA
jgi:hypothetical protein